MQQPTEAHDTMIEPPNYAFGWYAPLLAREVSRKKIRGFNFMGKKLIAYRNDKNDVVILDSVCPHFGADLSKGDICEGQVRCYFHGFFFDENGQCTKGELVKNTEKLERIRVRKYSVDECAGQIWIWHGPDNGEPLIPNPIRDMNWEEWSTPVTSRQRTIVDSNMCYLTENIIDLQHFAVVHKWTLHEVVDGPRVDEDGTFIADIKVANNPGAQSPHAWVRALTHPLKMDSRIRFKVYSPGCAIAVSNPGKEIHKTKLGRNIVCIYPIDETTVSIRVAVCFKKSDPDGNIDYKKMQRSKRLDWLMAKIVSLIAVQDFDGDLKVWNNRKYLSRPQLVKEDGPMILFRKWYLRFWHNDYLHELIDPQTTGNKIPSIRVSQG
ncbi:MAG: Rieske 2Fe-2S domain-containing protein [Gammaproteobacteria bacterium]|nr:Rieske 2Fe-2S domain-containing protein [Gammaproteobacteria bacterium]